MEKDPRRSPADLRAEPVLLCKDRKRIKAIYLAAFPKEARMPFGLMLCLSCFPATKFLAFYDGDTLCGLIYMGKIVRQAYILFFAVDEALRSHGYGGRILRMLRARWPKCHIVVSIEPCREGAPDLALRRRRKAFYMQNGYQDSGYDIKLGGIEQEVLVSGGAFNRARFSVFLLGYSCLAIIPRIWKRK